MTAYDVLGVTMSASHEEIKEGWFRVANKTGMHPIRQITDTDVPPMPIGLSRKTEEEKIFDRALRCYAVLRDQVARERYNASIALFSSVGRRKL